MKRVVFFTLWTFWSVTVVPGAALSLWIVGEPPLWPHFSPEATFEGFSVWAVFAAWIYLSPIALIVTRKWWLNRIEGQNASN